MNNTDRASAEHQRRWLKPDWQRWMRHDAHLFAPPGTIGPKSYAARLVERMRAEEAQAAYEAEQKAWRADIARLRWMIADLKIDLALRRLRSVKALPSSANPLHHSNYQPRVPEGNPDGGQWTNGGRGAGKVQLAAMLMKDRVSAIFGQKDLFTEVGGGIGAGRVVGGSPWLPAFRRGGPAAGVLQIPGRRDIQLVSGKDGPAAAMPWRGSGYDILNRTHLEATRLR